MNAAVAIALVLGLGLLVALLSIASATRELKDEVENLKARVAQLEAQAGKRWAP